MADIENNNKLISIDGLTIYHNKLAKFLSNTYLTKTDASNTYLTPKQGDNRYIPSSWTSRFVQYDIDASQQQLNSITLKKDTLTVKNLIVLNSTPIADNDVVNKLYVDNQVNELNTQISELNTQISELNVQVEETGIKLDSTQQELNELKASLYGYVFSEDTTNFSKLDISALPNMINNNNVAYNTRLMLDTIKGRSVKWTQLVKTSLFKDTQTISGVTFTFNKTNGTITVNGTATEDISFAIMKDDGALNSLWTPADYAYMRGCPTGGSLTTYYLLWGNTAMKDTGTGIYDKPSKSATQIKDTTVVYTGLQIIIKSGVTMTNKVFCPQLFNVSNIYGLNKEPATITDFNKDYPYDIYPYGKQEILTTKVSGIKIRAGYKNLLDKTKFAATQTINGVTFTNNGDGSYTLNGTASAAINFKFYNISSQYLSSDMFSSVLLFQGCPAEQYQENYGQYAVISSPEAKAYTIWERGIGNTHRGLFGVGSIDCYIICVAGQTFNNVKWKPQLINLTNTYGEGNEPTTVAQFNKDFPDINDIPYPEQTISFVEQTLYGINDVQDTLQVVKDTNGYKLDLIHNITSIDMGDMNYYEWRYHGNTLGWVTYSGSNPFKPAHNDRLVPNGLLTQNFATVGRQFIEKNSDNTWGYNKTICIDQYNTIYSQNKDVTTGAEYKESVKGQILYGAARTPTTTTLATLTKEQVTALFAKGYCVEMLGNDDNKIIVRPDLSLNMVTKLIGGNTNE